MLLKLGSEKPLQTTVILHKARVKGHQLAFLDTPHCCWWNLSSRCIWKFPRVLMHLERQQKGVACPLKAKTFQT